MTSRRRADGWRSGRAIALALALLVPSAAQAARLIGASFEDGILYDVDSETGVASNPRPIHVGSTPVDFVAGIEFGAGGTLYAITSESLDPVPSFPSTLLTIDPATGAAAVVAALAETLAEGDLAFDPATGDLLAFARPDGFAPYRLIRIDPGDGATMLIGEIADLGIDPSGLAIAADGVLYALDTSGDDDALLRLDLADASIESASPISPPIGNLAGMDFDPASGLLYVADGGSVGTDALYTLDPVTGDLDVVGSLEIADGLSALAVPEPGAGALAALGAALALARARLR